MKKKYVSRLLAGCLTVTMLTPTGALASVPQPVVTQEASQEAGQENETENKEQAEEYAADSAAEVQTDETEAAENRTAAGGSRRRGCHVRRGREQHRRYLRPYTVKGQFLQRGRRAGLKTVY